MEASGTRGRLRSTCLQHVVAVVALRARLNAGARGADLTCLTPTEHGAAAGAERVDADITLALRIGGAADAREARGYRRAAALAGAGVAGAARALPVCGACGLVRAAPFGVTGRLGAPVERGAEEPRAACVDPPTRATGSRQGLRDRVRRLAGGVAVSLGSSVGHRAAVGRRGLDATVGPYQVRRRGALAGAQRPASDQPCSKNERSPRSEERHSRLSGHWRNGSSVPSPCESPVTARSRNHSSGAPSGTLF